jgi:hypothetical protein
MDLLSSTDVNLRLHNITLGNYTFCHHHTLLEIIFQNVFQSRCHFIFHLICTTEMLSLQLRFHGPEEAKVWWQKIQHCHLGIYQVAPMQESREISNNPNQNMIITDK